MDDCNIGMTRERFVQRARAKHRGLYVFEAPGMDTVGTDLSRMMAKSGPYRANELRLSRVIYSRISTLSGPSVAKRITLICVSSSLSYMLMCKHSIGQAEDLPQVVVAELT